MNTACETAPALLPTAGKRKAASIEEPDVELSTTGGEEQGEDRASLESEVARDGGECPLHTTSPSFDRPRAG
jgi:hypothetical protein